MLFFLLICLRHKSKSKESYGKCIDFFKTKIPLDKRDKSAKKNIDKMTEAFGNNKIFYNETAKIIKNNENEFAAIGYHIRKIWHLENSKKITNSSIVRCMGKNIHFFAYAILEMKEVYPDDFEKVKNYYLQHKLIEEITNPDDPYWIF